MTILQTGKDMTIIKLGIPFIAALALGGLRHAGPRRRSGPGSLPTRLYRRVCAGRPHVRLGQCGIPGADGEHDRAPASPFG